MNKKENLLENSVPLDFKSVVNLTGEIGLIKSLGYVCSHQWYPNDISEDVTVFTCTKCGESQ